jgi:hypothetical protein
VWRIEYFEIMSQIGPIILVAYVLERRLYDKRVNVPRLQILVGLLFSVVAEFTALAVTAGVWPSDREVGLGVAALFLVGVSSIPAMLASDTQPRWRDPAVVVSWAFIAGAAYLVVTGFVG